MWSTTKLQFGLVILLVIICISPFIATPAAATTAQLEIISVDSAQHPTLRTTVVVRDLYGQGVANLGAGNFVIEEGDQTIPGELIQIQPLDNVPQPLTVAIVADISVFLGDDELRDIRKDIQSFVEELVSANNTSIEVGLFVPSDGRSDAESIHTVPFTTEGAPVIDALTDIKPHEAETPLYNTIVTTINTAANRAEQRSGPAYVVVFGDGIDRTSIVGSGTSGANEAAQIAETRHVQVNAFGYGQSLEEGSGALRQLTGRTNGLYQSTPNTRQLTDFAAQLQGFTTKGIYELGYTSTLPADGAEHAIDIHANVGTLRLSANTQVLIAREWDHTVPADMNVQFDMQAYPDITVLAQPLNQLRQTVPDLTNQDFTLSLDGELLETALDVTNMPLDANDPAASQSVALVVDQAGPAAEDIRNMATALLQEPALSNSRISLFVPGVPNETPEFTHDHNALINTLRQIPVDASAQSSANATLQRAIDEVAQDGTNAQRPAAVILISDRVLSPEERARTLTIARDLGVIIHTVVPSASTTTPAPTYLAEATTGLHLNNPQPADLTDFATQITQYEASTYRLAFQMPLLEEQRAYNLEVQVADLSATEEVMPVVPGTIDVRSPVPIYAQILLFITLASVLTASAFVPTYLNNRRNLCPKCQRVRRKSWGDACLFCEQQTAKKQSQPSNEIPLTGFAFQGAALVQPDDTDGLDLGSAHHSEQRHTGNGISSHPDTDDDDIFSGKDGVGLGGFALQGASLIQPGFADNVDLNSISHMDPEKEDTVEAQPVPPEINQSEKQLDKLDATSANFIRRIFGDDSTSLPPTQDNQFDQDHDTVVPTPNNQYDIDTVNESPDPIDQARSQTHTDFWGSLPDEQPTVEESITQDEPESPITQPPPLPMFRDHQKQLDTPRPRPQIPQEVQEPTHTDFWGPLPTDKQQGAAAWQDEPSPYTSAKERTSHQPTHNKRAQTNYEEAVTQTEEHTPSSHQSTEVSPVARKQVSSQEERSPGDEHQESHTDFWGPLG